MADWKQCTLGDLFTIKHGYAFKGEYFGKEGSYIVLTPGNFLEEGGFKEKGDKEKWYSGKIPEDYILSYGDLIVVMTEQAEGLLGSSAMIPLSNRYLHNQRLGLIQNFNGVDKIFLYYIFNSKSVRQQIRASCSGVKVRHTSPSRIYEVQVFLPPLPTQNKIASILSAYDDLIENNTRRIKILEEMAQTIYNEWFVKFRFPGHENVKMVDSELGMIPEGWEVKTLDELVNTQYGYTESAQDKPIGPKYLRGMDINKTTYIDWDTVPYCPIPDEQLPKYKLIEGDIVVIRMADPGKVGIVEKEVNAVFASYLVRLSRKSNRIGPYYLFHFLISERYQGYITGASTGTTRKSASAGVLTGINILIPPEEILGYFESQVQVFRRLLNNLLERNTTLRHTRDLLLPRLISGEIDVSELDINVEEITA